MPWTRFTKRGSSPNPLASHLPLPCQLACPTCYPGFRTPFLNGLLLSIYVKEKTSRYTQIAEGLGFIVWVLLPGLALNALVGAWFLTRGRYGVAAVHGLVVIFIIALFWRSRR